MHTMLKRVLMLSLSVMVALMPVIPAFAEELPTPEHASETVTEEEALPAATEDMPAEEQVEAGMQEEQTEKDSEKENKEDLAEDEPTCDETPLLLEKPGKAPVRSAGSIARVSNDGGVTWEYFDALITGTYDGEEIDGAFSYAKTLSGEVIIETLFETHPRYTLTQGTEFNKDNATYILRTTKDEAWNPDHFRSVISRGWSGGNNNADAMFCINGGTTTLTTGDIILDGGRNEENNSGPAGRAVYINDGSLNANGKTTFRNFYLSANGGAVYAAQETTYTVSGEGDVLLENCFAQNGGAIGANSALTVANNGGSLRFNACRASELGGAVYVKNAVTMTEDGRTVFTDCKAVSGGGIYHDGTGNITLSNIAFGNPDSESSGCFAEMEGGSIWSSSLGLIITDCDFYYSKAGSGTNNNNTHGGAICVNGSGTNQVFGCVFVHCSVNTRSTSVGYGNGGAIYIGHNGLSLTIDKSDARRSSFTDCSAYRYGGAVILEKNGGSTLSISNSDFENCKTTYRDGGAVYSDSNSTTFKHCTFKQCHSDSTSGDYDGGGAIYMNGDMATISSNIGITNCQFEDCYAKKHGGAIHFYSSNTVATLTDVIIKGHEALGSGTVNASLGGAIYSKGNVTVKKSTRNLLWD